MLTRNCQKTIGLLITDEDFNVRLTVAKKATATSRFTQKSLIEGEWKTYIWNAIGSYSTTDIELHVEILTAIGGKVTSKMAILAGNEMVNYFWETIRYADGIRIIITQNKKKLSWIIVRP